MKGILAASFGVVMTFGLIPSAFAQANCPGSIIASYSTSQDIQVTSNTNCVTIGANNLTVNCNGYHMICNNAGGCNAGANVPNGYTGTLVKNCNIVKGTGSWYYGVNNGSTSGAANTTTVKNVAATDTTVGVLNPYTVQHAIFNRTTNCLLSNVGDKDGLIEQNYCHSTGDGMDIDGYGTDSTHEPKIDNNYIRSPSTASAIACDNNAMDVENNMFDGASISLGTNTFSEFNICDDDSLDHCEEPANLDDGGQQNFTLNQNFTR